MVTLLYKHYVGIPYSAGEASKPHQTSFGPGSRSISDVLDTPPAAYDTFIVV